MVCTFKVGKTDNTILRIKNIVLNLLLNMQERENEFCDIEKNPAIERALREMTNFSNLCGGVETLARLSGYSLSRLYGIMKKNYGITPNKIIEKFITNQTL